MNWREKAVVTEQPAAPQAFTREAGTTNSGSALEFGCTLLDGIGKPVDPAFAGSMYGPIGGTGSAAPVESARLSRVGGGVAVEFTTETEPLQVFPT